MPRDKPTLTATDFEGTVFLKHYLHFLDGRQYVAFHGRCTVYSDKDAVGFEAKGGETANWIVRVEGARGSMNILGCQIRAVYQGSMKPEPNADICII